MRNTTMIALALATFSIACGGKHQSTDSSTVHFLAIDTSSGAASVTFQAFSASDRTRLIASQRIQSYDAASAGREFTGDVAVAPGSYAFRAIAHDANGTAIGEGEAEDGAAIVTTKGAKTSVSITILPYQQQPTSPVITSFVVTPTGSTIPPNTPVSLAATVAHPGPGILQYIWRQDCTHGVFSTPTNGLTATWSNPQEESCTISFTVTDPDTGRSDTRSVGVTCSCLGTNQAGLTLVTCEEG